MTAKKIDMQTNFFMLAGLKIRQPLLNNSEKVPAGFYGFIGLKKFRDLLFEDE